MRVDAGGFAVDVPVDHDAATAVAGVPLGHQVLIPGSELLGVGSAGRGAFAPDRSGPLRQGGIDDLPDGGAKLVFGDVTTANTEQVPVVGPGLPGAHALDASIRA